MAYNNQIILRGNLGKDPEVIPNPDGSTRVEITICTQDAYKVNEDWKQLPEVWHKVTFFGQQAQQHAGYFKVGQRVKIEGSLSYYKVDAQDSKSYWVASIRGERIDKDVLPTKSKVSEEVAF
ncbi:single stranded DNA-binding protein [Xenococcus sp. PCC 7305]|uniref:single-stranded DNA-binding protein n=1 Tax=Xenococcus sp. PCC 7305 TaxID=102125 RepID=UPI0002ACBB33|nr:single-stranded DNA-binding protein [Xenococcus sp. PCC 7305]ELS02728.1 single stranded DNA-binding protein [Xenococcus sp. PCC 7305]